MNHHQNNNPSPVIMIVAGELSGEHYGAHLAKALRETNPQVKLIGVGGREMADNGVELLFNISALSVVGVWEVAAGLKTIYSVFRGLCRQLDAAPPDLLILIDYPDFNLRLAKAAKKRGIKILYYISPQVWAWRKGRTKLITELVDKIAVILPFEAALYQKVGAAVEYVGHPLLETIPSAQFKERIVNHGEGRIVGLLPGSRRNEIHFLLKPMLDAARILWEQNSDLEFILPVAPGLDFEEIERISLSYKLPLKLLHGQAREAMKEADLIIVASGTATLEGALIGVPMVVVYKVAGLTYFLGRMLIDTPFIALANIAAQKAVVPELIQDAVNPENIAACAGKLLNNLSERVRMQTELVKVREKLGESGASRKVAALAWKLMDSGQWIMDNG